MKKGVGYCHAMPVSTVRLLWNLVEVCREVMPILQPMDSAEKKLVLKFKVAVDRLERAKK